MKKFKINQLFLFVSIIFFFNSCKENSPERYLFFLHNRFLETHELIEAHPQYGKVEYLEIIQTFEKSGFKTISEKRTGDTNVQAYANGIKNQINDLISKGVLAKNITVVGTSKGGYIAQYISTFLKNPKVNFVFVACYQDSDIENYPEINFCGNILTIFEKTDPFGVSAKARKATSACKINHFKEIEMNTGLGHGFLFKPLPEWIDPTINWAARKYESTEK